MVCRGTYGWRAPLLYMSGAALGGVLVGAAILKSVDPVPTVVALSYFTNDLGIERAPLRPFTLCLIVLECWLGVLLLVRPGLMWVRVATCAMFVMFLAFVVWLRIKHPGAACGCGVRLIDQSATGSSLSLIQNVVFVIVALGGLLGVEQRGRSAIAAPCGAGGQAQGKAQMTRS